MAVAEKPLTLEQFMALPEEEPPLEYADGVVTQKVSPQGQHSTLQLAFAKHLDRWHKVARAFPELRFSCGGVSRVPDVSVYRLTRIPRDARGRVANAFTEPPDITVEIVSPGQSVNALVRRSLWYVSHGVLVALLVDPDDESVLAFRPEGAPTGLHGADQIDLSEVLPNFKLTVDELFESLRV